MKSLRHTLIASCLLTSLSGLSMAQNAPANAPNAQVPRAERFERMRQHMNEHHARNLADLHDKLKLMANQESAWHAFAQTLQYPSQLFLRPDPAAMEKLSTPERLEQMQAHKAQRDAVMQKHVDATKTFYAELSAEQKKIFDAETFKHYDDLRGSNYRGGGRFWPY